MHRKKHLNALLVHENIFHKKINVYQVHFFMDDCIYIFSMQQWVHIMETNQSLNIFSCGMLIAYGFL